MREEVLAVYNTLTFEESHNTEINAILSIERQIFICRQTTGERTDQYVTELKRLNKEYVLGNLTESMINDRYYL